MNKSQISEKKFLSILARIVVQILSIVIGVFVPYLLIAVSKLPFLPNISSAVNWDNQLVWAVILFFSSSSLLNRLDQRKNEKQKKIERKEDAKNIVNALMKKMAPVLQLANHTAEIVNQFDREKYFSESSEIDVATLSGNITLELRKKETIETIIHRKNHSKMRCLIGNPFSEIIKSRYIYDEPIHKKAGYLQIIQNLITLFNVREGWFKNKQPENQHDVLQIKNKLKINVYNSYPMLAIFRGDNSVFMSYYAYKEIDTKWIKTDASTSLGKDFCSHFNELFEDSYTLSEWIIKYYNKLDEESKRTILFSKFYSGIFVINKEKKIIFQLRDNKHGIHNPNRISVFGGRAEYREDPMETAVRELQEETDIVINSDRLVKIISRPELEIDNPEECVFCTYYYVEIDSIKININEGAGCKILTLQEALSAPELTEGPKWVLKNSDKLNKILRTINTHRDRTPHH